MASDLALTLLIKTSLFLLTDFFFQLLCYHILNHVLKQTVSSLLKQKQILLQLQKTRMRVCCKTSPSYRIYHDLNVKSAKLQVGRDRWCKRLNSLAAQTYRLQYTGRGM